jgi:hypothetical protein
MITASSIFSTQTKPLTISKLLLKMVIIEFAGFSSEMRLESDDDKEKNIHETGYPAQSFL